MAKPYRRYVPEQDLLLPPSLREWLPEGSPGVLRLDTILVVGPFVVAILAYHVVRRWWRDNEWKRRRWDD